MAITVIAASGSGTIPQDRSTIISGACVWPVMITMNPINRLEVARNRVFGDGYAAQHTDVVLPCSYGHPDVPLKNQLVGKAMTPATSTGAIRQSASIGSGSALTVMASPQVRRPICLASFQESYSAATPFISPRQKCGPGSFPFHQRIC
jgi:hypothetical protein